MNKILTYTEAIKEATEQIMLQDDNVIIMGLGVSYKNGADGTMGNLKELYPNRVFDVPVSEGCNTGVGVGAAINGLRPIIHHGRVEFALFGLDQIITQAAKWHYIFKQPVPVTFRINIGRAWGNGAKHTQSLYPMWANTTGLKVVVPSTPKMAKGLFISAVKDNNPVVYLEPRWLFAVKEEVSEGPYEIPLDKARVVKEGSDFTIVTYAEGVVDAIRAQNLLKQHGFNIELEIVDLVSINPIDYETVRLSVKKSGRLLCIDMGNLNCSIGSSIIGSLSDLDYICANVISCPDVPCPMAPNLAKNYYPTYVDITNSVLKHFNKSIINHTLTFNEFNFGPTITL